MTGDAHDVLGLCQAVLDDALDALGTRVIASDRVICYVRSARIEIGEALRRHRQDEEERGR